VVPETHLSRAHFALFRHRKGAAQEQMAVSRPGQQEKVHAVALETKKLRQPVPGKKPKNFILNLELTFVILQIRLSGSNLCVQSEKDVKSKGSYLQLQPCLRIKSQVFR